MNARALRCTSLAIASALALCAAGGAQAAFRTYLSIDGSDVNACTVQLPCRLLPAALAAVDANGEVWILDSANYNTGTVTINKNVTILAVPGVIGSIVATGSGDGLSIAGSGIKVTLKNLAFVNLTSSPGINGLTFSQGASLTIIESSFTGLINGVGVKVNSVGSKTQIVNSIFNGNVVGVQNLGGIVNIDNSTFTNNAIAVNANGAGYGGGVSGNASATPPGPTQVRLSGGNIWDNGVAFKMDNPGNRLSGQCNGTNIFPAPSSNRFAMGILGNPTFLQVTGTMDQNPGCVGPPASVTIDSWQPQQSNSSPL